MSAEKKSSMATTALKVVVPLIVGVAIGLMPVPEGLTAEAVKFIGIFAAVILWLIVDAMPTFLAVIVGCALCVLCGVAKYGVAFSGFASSTVWTVIGVFGFAAVISESGLLKRVALLVLSKFPENYKGQIAGIMTTGLVISPMIPSTTAKTAIITPFAMDVAKAFGYKKNGKGITGIFCAAYIASQYLGSAFLSGSLLVFLILGFCPAEVSAQFTWVQWFLACAVWLVVIFVLSYLAIVFLYNPAKDAAGNAADIEKGTTKKQLSELGPLSSKEKASIAFLVIAFVGWTAGSYVGLDAGIWAIIIWGFMMVMGYFKPADFVTKIGWPIIFFIGGILSLASMISSLGISSWLAPIAAPILAPITANPFVFIVALCVLTYAVRLVIVSQAATVAIFVAALSGVAATVGISPWVVAFVCYMSTLIWHFEFSSTQFMTTMGLTNGEMTTHKKTLPMNFAYMAINLIACVASVPVWQMMGLM